MPGLTFVCVLRDKWVLQRCGSCTHGCSVDHPQTQAALQELGHTTDSWLSRKLAQGKPLGREGDPPAPIKSSTDED